MSLHTWLAFLSVALLVTFSPGPAVVLALRNGAQYSFGSALIAITGNLSAMLFYALIASVGVVVLFEVFPMVVHWVQIFGGLYLVWIGVKLMRASWQRVRQKTSLVKSPQSRLKLYLEALLVGLSNPKAILFYSALFPQFIARDGNVVGQSMLLAFTFAACSFTALSFYAWSARTLTSKFSHSNYKAAANGVTGAAFIGFGGALIWKSA